MCVTYTGYACVFYVTQAYTLLFLLSYVDMLLMYEHVWHLLIKNVSESSPSTLKSLYIICKLIYFYTHLQ